MKERFLTLVVSTAVIVVGGVVYWMLPNFDSPRRRLSAQIGPTTEGARRLLDEYGRGLASVAGSPVEAPVGDLDRDRIGKLVESDNKFVAQVLDAEADRLNGMRREAYTRLRELDEKFNSLGADEEVSPPAQARFGNNVNAMTSHMVEGVTQRSQSEQHLESILDKAASRLNGAVSEQVGELSGRDSLTANRLLASALMQKGRQAHREASRAGQDLLKVVHDLSALSIKAGQLRSATMLVEQSGVDSRIEAARQKVADAQEVVNRRKATALELEDTVRQIKDLIAEQESIADRARAMMDELEMRGLRYEDPSAVESFRSQYEQLAESYRSALRRSQALKHGTLANAEIDKSGDLLLGEYVSSSDDGIDYQPGLDEYNRLLAEANNHLAEAERILAQARLEHERLEDMRRRLVAAVQQATENLSKVADDAREMLARYKQSKLVLTGAEDQALGFFDKAARSYKTAETAATQRINDVPIDATDESPGSLVRDDRWLAAHIKCQYADANMAGAQVLMERIERLTAAKRVLVALTQSIDGIADPGVPGAEIDEAQMQGKERIEKAITALESAARDLRSHWTVGASLAAADYMLYLFGEPSLIDVSVANYQNVVTGRESDPLIRPFKERLEQLKSR